MVKSTPALVERVQAFQRVGDVAVDVGHRPQHALAAETLAAVAQLDRLVHARRGARRRDGPPSGAGVEDHLGLDGRIAAGVEDFPPDHVLNGAHYVTPSASALVGHRPTRLVGASLGNWEARRSPLHAPRRRPGRPGRASAAPVRGRCPAGAPGRPRRRARRRPAARSPRRRRPGWRRPPPAAGSTSRPHERGDPSPPGPTRRRRGPGSGIPTESAFRCNLVDSRRAGRSAGMPSVTLARPFSSLLISSQLATHLVCAWRRRRRRRRGGAGAPACRARRGPRRPG